MPASSLVTHLKYATLALMFWVAVVAYPFQIAFAGKGCNNVKVEVGNTLRAGYAYLATAVTSRGLVVMFFINRAGEWKILGVDDDLNSCVVASGEYWNFAYEQGI